MRRFIAYITLTITLLFGAAINTITPLKSVISNHEYQTGREFTYRISDKEDPDEVFANDDMEAINEVASVMDQRMTNFGVSEFNIAKEGNNIIRTSTTLQSEEEYNRLQVYLNYDANFTIRIGDDDNTTAELHASDIFDGQKARVEYRSSYAFIIFPLSNPELFKNTIVNVASSIQEEKQSPAPEGAERPDLVKEATIVIWSDFNPDKDSYLSPSNESQGKIFLSFDYRSMYWDDDQTEIGVASPLEGADENATSYTTAQIKKASETARYMANVFNAGELNYKVDFLFANTLVDPTVEPIISLTTRDTIALSATLFAGLISYLLIAVIAFAIYRLPILNALSSGALTFLGTLLIFNAIQIEFSTSAIIGFIVVSLVSLLATIIYAAKFRSEVYKGRSFKKAHSEAINKSSFINLDLLVIILLTGIFTYFFGGAALAGFATTLIFGSIVMVLSVLIHNAIILPLLAYNTTGSQSYHRYGINESKVPNVLNDEKQTYFGRFVNYNPDRNAKLNIGILGALSAITAILILSFGAFTSINPYNLVTYDQNTTRLYFQVSEGSFISDISATNNPVKLLELIEFQDGSTLKVVEKDGVALIERHTYTVNEEVGEVLVPTTYNFYIYTLDGTYSGDELVTFKPSINDVAQPDTPFSEALNVIVQQLDDEAVVSVNLIKKEAITPHYGRVALVSVVVLVATSFYLMLRFGLTRGVTNLVESFVAGSLVFLFFLVTRIAIPPLATMGVFVAIIFVAFLNILIFNNVRDVEKDQANRALTRREKFNLGLRYSLSLLYVTTLVFAVTFLIFTLLGPIGVSSVYLSGVIALLGGLYVIMKFNTTLLSGTLNLLGLLPKFERKRSAKKVQRTSIKSSSAEPEEAVFIGIND